MTKPLARSIAIATLAWFTAVTLCGHAFHQLEAHAARHSACGGHAATCDEDRRVEPAWDAIADDDERHTDAAVECGTCAYYSQSQQVAGDASVKSPDLLQGSARPHADACVSSLDVSLYDSRGPPVGPFPG